MEKQFQKHPQFYGALLTLLGGVCWGVSGSCGQYLFTRHGVTSFWLVPIRLLIAGAILLVWYAIKDHRALLAPWRDKTDRRQLLVYGLAGVSLCQLTYFYTIQLSSAGVATILQDLSPVFILLCTCVAAHRAPRGGEVGSIVLALVGVGLIVTHGSLHDFAVPPLALLCGVLCALSVTIYNVYPARLLQRHPAPVLQGWSFLMGGTLLALIMRPWQYTVHVSVPFLLAFAAIVVLGNLIAFNVYMTGVRLIGPSRGILYGFSEPVAAAAISCVWLGASFTIWDAVGFACIFLMLVLLSLRTKDSTGESDKAVQE